jgi:hypothetical protein
MANVQISEVKEADNGTFRAKVAGGQKGDTNAGDQ